MFRKSTKKSCTGSAGDLIKKNREIKEATVDKQYITDWKIFLTKRLLNRWQWHIKRGRVVGLVCLS